MTDIERRRIVKASTATFLIAAALIPGGGSHGRACAQSPGDPPRRVEHARAALACADSMEVIVSTLEFRPGESLDLHLHHGLEAVYVIEGASVLMGKDTTMLKTGASLLNLRDKKHAGFTVLGSTPLKLYTVHVVDRGKPVYDYKK
jgi:quercetin dioxygenase-like cupin family protein